MQANKINSKKESGEGEKPEVDNGTSQLMTVLYKYAKKFMEKKGVENISVGVVGFPNTGKSSVINALKNQNITGTGSIPGLTKKMHEVKLNRFIRLLDSPGYMVSAKSDDGEVNYSQILRSCLNVDELEDPFGPVKFLMTQIDKTEILRFYRIGNFDDVETMLETIAQKKGLTEKVEKEKTQKTKKGKVVLSKTSTFVPNKDQAARRFIRDF